RALRARRLRVGAGGVFLLLDPFPVLGDVVLRHLALVFVLVVPAGPFADERLVLADRLGPLAQAVLAVGRRGERAVVEPLRAVANRAHAGAVEVPRAALEAGRVPVLPHRAPRLLAEARALEVVDLGLDPDRAEDRRDEARLLIAAAAGVLRVVEDPPA